MAKNKQELLKISQPKGKPLSYKGSRFKCAERRAARNFCQRIASLKSVYR